MNSTANLTTKARFLKNASPQAYDAFIEAFTEYAWSVTAILADVTENYQLHQGHAQQCKKLMQALEEAKNG